MSAVSMKFTPASQPPCRASGSPLLHPSGFRTFPSRGRGVRPTGRSAELFELHKDFFIERKVPGRSVRSSAFGLRRDPHGSVKQIHHDELEDGR